MMVQCCSVSPVVTDGTGSAGWAGWAGWAMSSFTKLYGSKAVEGEEKKPVKPVSQTGW